MSKFRAISIAVIACSLTGFAGAETLQMGDSPNASRFEHEGKPSRGMTQARVESEYGQPSARNDAVGEPPISRWEYADFVVFFEYDRVIHAVTKR
jgi:hypothetical protein